MSIHIEIPEPLAGQVQDAAKSRAVSPEGFIIDIVSKTLADDAAHLRQRNGHDANPLLGLLADDTELADFISESALERRRTLAMRAPRG